MGAMKSEQTSLLDEYDRRQQITLRREFDRKQAWMKDNFVLVDSREFSAFRNKPMPEGTEIIVEWPGWCPEDRIEKTRFYRTKLGFHRTVSGPEADLRWDPSDEFPDEPPWTTFYGSDQKYTYPGWPLILWRRKT